MPNPDYKIVISNETFKKLNKYKQQLQNKGLEYAGHYLKLLLENKFNNAVNNDLNFLTDEDFLNLLFKTKSLYIKDAANNNFHHYWNLEEQSILSDISYIINAQAFNNGIGNITFLPPSITNNSKHWNKLFKNNALPKEIFITSDNGEIKKLKGNDLITVENSMSNKMNNNSALPLELTTWQKHKKKIIATAILGTAVISTTIGLVLTATGFGSVPGILLTTFGVKLGFTGLALFGINAGLSFGYGGLTASALMGFFSGIIIGAKKLFNAGKNFAKKFIDRAAPVYMDEIPEEETIPTTSYNNLSIKIQKTTKLDTNKGNSDTKTLSHASDILTKKTADTRPCCRITGATKHQEMNKTVLHISVFDSSRLKNIVSLFGINGFNPIRISTDHKIAIITITHLDRDGKGGLNQDSVERLITLLSKFTDKNINLLDPKTDFKQLKKALYEVNELSFDSLNKNNPELEAQSVSKTNTL